MPATTASILIGRLSGLRGLTQLDRALFNTTFDLPCILLKRRSLNRFLPCAKAIVLTGFKNVKAVQHVDEQMARILCVPSFSDDTTLRNDIQEKATKLEVPIEYSTQNIQVVYENWPAMCIIEAIVPEQHPFGAYSQIGHIVHVNLREAHSQIGHIVHVNLREAHVPYKLIIAQVLMDKIPGCLCVVNKSDTIGDSQFRTFQPELLAGQPNYQATVKENGLTFKFDFSKVFWNPRLGTEHKRLLTERVKKHDVVYDVMAGCGPFAILAARRNRRCSVLANDLNPDSVSSLQENIKLNSVKLHSIHQLDAAQFITGPLTEHLKEKLTTSNAEGVYPPQYNAIMNLPALAVTFLPQFIGILHGLDTNKLTQTDPKFFVHCYLFTKNAEIPKETAQAMCADQFANLKDEIEFVQTHFVRTVATEKHMFCVSMRLKLALLMHKKGANQLGHSAPQAKKSKMDEAGDTK